MPDPNYLWLYGFVLLIGGCLLTKEKVKQVCLGALLVYATAFVCQNLWTSAHSPAKTGKGGLGNSNNADVLLKIESAVNTFQRNASSLTPREPSEMVNKRRQEMLVQAEEMLRKSAAEQPEDAVLLGQLIVLSHELSHPTKTYRERLSALDTDKAKELSHIFDELYGNPRALDSAKRKELAAQIENQLNGWYEAVSLMRLYSATKQPEELKKVTAQFDDANMRFVARGFLLIGVVVLAFLGGAIVILASLFIMPRRITNPEHRDQIAAPAKYGALTIYAVFIAWLATQFVASILMQPLFKNVHMSKQGPLIAGLVMFGSYLVCNAPGLVWVYFLALKPRAIKFFEGVRLRFKVDRNGPFRLIVYGFLTWLAAVPLVVVAYLIANKYLGSQGSNNPVISWVMQAARGNSIPAIVVFYATLGVLAPICEEILFRGFLYTALRKYWGILPSMLLSAGLFAGVHMDAGGFLPLMTLGMLFAFTLEKTRSIVPCMVAHGLWNSGTFTMVLLVFSP